MTERTNVNDLEFLNDGIAEEDYKRDVNAADEDIRALAQDLWGTGGVIIEGGELDDGTNPDTFKITPNLRARDKDLRPVNISGEEDNLAALDTTGSWNYIAVKHKWAYDMSRGAYDSSVAYYTVRKDDYETDVALTRQDEANGYIVLGRAKWNAGLTMWEYDYSVRTRDLSLYIAGKTIPISEKSLDTNPWYPAECDDLPNIFSWDERVIMVQFADDQDPYTAGEPVDLHTTVKLTTSWQVFGQLKDTGGTLQDLSVRANSSTEKRLEFKTAAGTVVLRGLITLLGGDYNSADLGGGP